MTTYYFSNSGSDRNSGTSQQQAWASLSKTAKLTLNAGDEILLEAGSIFDEQITLSRRSGNTDNPILISSYGKGEAPLIDDSHGNGIRAVASDYVIVENINIATTAYGGFAGQQSDNWIIRNMEFTGTGGSQGGRADGAINWSKSSNILIENITVNDSIGDSIYMQDMSDVVVRDSIFDGVEQSKSDNIQISGDNIAVVDNMMIAGTNKGVAKGNLVVQDGDNAYLHNNYMEGGGYGASFSYDSVIVDSNVITDHDVYGWSFGLGFTDERNGNRTHNISVTDNHFSGAPRGIVLDGGFNRGTQTVYNIDVSDNVFHDWSDDGIYMNRTKAHGSITDNVHHQDGDTLAIWNNPYSHTNVDSLKQRNNRYEDNKIMPQADDFSAQKTTSEPTVSTLVIEASGKSFYGAPTMAIHHNNTLVEEVDVNANASKGNTQEFTVTLLDVTAGDTVSISYVNDVHGRTDLGQVRDLFVHSIDINGESLSVYDAALSRKVSLDKADEDLNFYSNGTAIFDVHDIGLDTLQTPMTPNAASKSVGDVFELDSKAYLALQESEGNILGVNGNIDINNFHDATDAFALIDDMVADYFY